jgi:hypothetical protein
MVYLMMADGSRKDLPDAATACIEGENFVCRREDGEVVETFDKLAVKAYSSSESKFAQFFESMTQDADRLSATTE